MYDKNDVVKNEELLKSMRPGTGRRIAENYTVKNIADCFEQTEDGLALRTQAAGGDQTMDNLTIRESLVVQAAEAVELLEDPSLEAWDSPTKLTHYDDFTYGEGTGATIQREASIKRTGSYSAKLTVDPAGGTFKCILVPYTGVAGQIVNFSVFARRALGGNAEVALTAFNGPITEATEMYDFDAGEWIPYTGGTPTSLDSNLTDDFVKYQTTLLMPESGQILILVVGTGGAGEVSYFDDFSLTTGARETSATFADGIKTKISTAELSSTPLKAEFTALLGNPADKNGIVVIVQDTANSKTYFVTSDGTEWYYSLATLAL